jgi:hypothetical protein
MLRRVNCESLGNFCHRISRENAELTPYALMAGKPVEAVERLALEGEGGDVENEPRIMPAMRRPQPSPQTAALIAIILLTN